jgi:hypothetical protein
MDVGDRSQAVGGEVLRRQLSGSGGNPMLMARTAGVYSALALIPKGYKRMLEHRE